MDHARACQRLSETFRSPERTATRRASRSPSPARDRAKRRASRSPSPARKRADDGPVVLRRARPGPSAADLPTELVELVVRCAAEDGKALVRVARTCRLLERTARALILPVLIDHAVVWQTDKKWKHINDRVPETTDVLFRGVPLTRYLAEPLVSAGTWRWFLKNPVFLPEMIWPRSWEPLYSLYRQHIGHLLCPWPTAAYRAHIAQKTKVAMAQPLGPHHWMHVTLGLPISFGPPPGVHHLIVPPPGLPPPGVHHPRGPPPFGWKHPNWPPPAG